MAAGAVKVTATLWSNFLLSVPSVETSRGTEMVQRRLVERARGFSFIKFSYIGQLYARADAAEIVCVAPSRVLAAVPAPSVLILRCICLNASYGQASD